jgi:hypothetical protein
MRNQNVLQPEEVREFVLTTIALILEGVADRVDDKYADQFLKSWVARFETSTRWNDIQSVKSWYEDDLPFRRRVTLAELAAAFRKRGLLVLGSRVYASEVKRGR